jgi:hypothetical protein
MNHRPRGIASRTVVLTSDQREELEQRVAGRTVAHRDRIRAAIILALAEEPSPSVAARLVRTDVGKITAAELVPLVRAEARVASFVDHGNASRHPVRWKFEGYPLEVRESAASGGLASKCQHPPSTPSTRPTFPMSFVATGDASRCRCAGMGSPSCCSRALRAGIRTARA